MAVFPRPPHSLSLLCGAANHLPTVGFGSSQQPVKARGGVKLKDWDITSAANADAGPARCGDHSVQRPGPGIQVFPRSSCFPRYTMEQLPVLELLLKIEAGWIAEVGTLLRNKVMMVRECSAVIHAQALQ